MVNGNTENGNANGSRRVPQIQVALNLFAHVGILLFPRKYLNFATKLPVPILFSQWPLFKFTFLRHKMGSGRSEQMNADVLETGRYVWRMGVGWGGGVGSNEKPEKNFVYMQSRVPTPGTYIW
jgi:hypothetical protein